MRLLTGWAFLGLFALAATAATGQEWSRFRGPNGTGIGTANIPVKWTTDDFNWKASLPGQGFSSPVVWGDRIFVTAGERKTGRRFVVCVDAKTGKILWQKASGAGKYRMHQRNSNATATPAADADHLYVTWGTPKQVLAVAYTHDGKVKWEADLGTFKGNHGYGMSPIVFEDMVILPNDQDGGGSLLALDKQTGKIRWKVPRQSGNATYSTPCVYRQPGKPAEIIFTNWQHGITSVNPKTGKVNWEISCFAPQLKERAIASPIVAGDLIVGTCGFVTAQKHFVAVRPGDQANGVKPKEVWRVERSVSYMPTPIVKGDRIYMCTERGVATCLESTTGKLIWQQRVPGKFSASPVCVGDRIYCVSDGGEAIVLAAAGEFKILARNPLGEATQSTPAIARGRIYFRTQGHLMSLGGSK